MARPRVDALAYIVAGVRRIHKADGSPGRCGPATLAPSLQPQADPGKWARRLRWPGRALDDVHEVGPLIAGDEPFQDVRFYVAERGFRLRGDAVGERLEDAALEVRARCRAVISARWASLMS